MKTNMKKLILFALISGILIFTGAFSASAIPNSPLQNSAPTIVSATASNITTTSATLNGEVNPNGSSTTAWFESSATGSQKLQMQNLGKGNNPVTMLPYVLNNLTPNMNYIFRVVAQNANGTTNGSWVPFTTTSTNPAAPTLTSLSPNNGNQGQILNVLLTGTGFVTGSTVNFSGSGITVNSTTINSLTSITVDISINQNASTGTRNVTVTNANGTSGAQIFTVNSATSCITPTISSISPNSVTAGTGALTIMVNGSDFNSSSIALFNNSARTTNYINSSQLSMTLTATDISSPGTGNVSVSNGTNCVSNSVIFTISSSSSGGGGGSGGGSGGGGGMAFFYPIVTTQSAGSVSTNSASLYGTINPRGFSATAWFEYGAIASLPYYNQTSHLSVLSGSLDYPFNQTLSGLTPNTTYYFRLVGNNYAGTVRGNILSFTTGSVVNTGSGTGGGTSTNYQNTSTSGNTNTFVSSVKTKSTESTKTEESSLDNNSKGLAAAGFLGAFHLLPRTATGWLLLAILVLIILIIARKLYSDYLARKAWKAVDANNIENLPV
jgi:hypothetical protein